MRMTGLLLLTACALFGCSDDSDPIGEPRSEQTEIGSQPSQKRKLSRKAYDSAALEYRSAMASLERNPLDGMKHRVVWDLIDASVQTTPYLAKNRFLTYATRYPQSIDATDYLRVGRALIDVDALGPAYYILRAGIRRFPDFTALSALETERNDLVNDKLDELFSGSEY